ncbi:MAG: hypothetical protein HYX87_02495 [Chloroflexi bacterium]|nr:hypothetical protein [Chloroflexota bacterium]
MGVGQLRDQEEQSKKESERKQKHATEGVGRLARGKEIKDANLAREQQTADRLKARETKESDKHATEDVGRLAKGKEIKDANLAHEQQTADRLKATETRESEKR